MSEPAFRSALRSAYACAGAAERVRLLRRALSLWPDLENPELSRADLWERARVAAHHASLWP